eukprot:TRINITY_DN1227_c0_g1_i4.p1 TRINITY_DN1227_c0_g1~~TRINITY_DN1227_c0_g1_i4.p1  ORF type:complete len:431 (-),score=78.61 TRINITY_DN1227_c0_g1_i4:452-1744(-)
MVGSMVCDPETNTCKIQNGGFGGSNSVARMLGVELLKGKEEKVEVSSLFGPGKIVALYFSAHWCPPCKGFTPRLANFYNQFKASHERAGDFEIVFVSSDKDEEGYNEYFAQMPWLGLPFANRKAKTELSVKFRISGIPALVILDGETGKIITKKGREMVGADPQGKEFPWQPKSLMQLLQGSLVNKAGETSDFDENVKGKHLLVYFSAHWCPPCRDFTPQLAEFYRLLQQERQDFEVVYVSGDREEEQFKEYLMEMPWLAVPYSEEKRRQELSQFFEVESIPTLVVIAPDGRVLTKEGRSKVSTVPQEFPWKPNPVEKLDGSIVKLLNTVPIGLLFEESQSALDVMQEFGEKMMMQEEDERDFLLLTAFEDSPLLQQVKKICGDDVKMAILVIQSQKLYKNDDVSSEGTRNFLQGFLDGTLDGEDLQLKS